MSNIHLSCSAMDTFRRCPYAYKLRVIDRIKFDETEAMRIGTSWHKMVENISRLPDYDKQVEVLTATLNALYDEASRPESLTMLEWEIERSTLYYGMVAKLRYQQQSEAEYEVIANEVEFDVPVFSLKTGAKLRTSLLGKIDQFLRNKQTGKILVGEQKSTVSAVDSGSSFWDIQKLSSQPKTYIYAAQYMQRRGELDFVGPVEPLIDGVLYDVWRRPQIRLKKLTFADFKKFAETGEYLGGKFKVEMAPEQPNTAIIDGVHWLGEWNAKQTQFTIRETPEMFGCRIYTVIMEDPDSYFAVKEVIEDSADMEWYGRELHSLIACIRTMRASGDFYHDENQCEPRGTYKCSYRSECYSNRG